MTITKKISIPAGAAEILRRLRGTGYEAYCVGGCVRDSLLGREPADWDICTSALPKETEACFWDAGIAETGLRHGTITVIRNHIPYEITTFRTEGPYLDHRRPAYVRFVPDLREDLARRDFTINAMAADAEGNIIDPFGGQEDLAAGTIRCVGSPQQRFSEDALRILRAVRFSSQLGFSIEPSTQEAMSACRSLLADISAERIWAEMNKLLCGQAAARAIEASRPVILQILPELAPCIGCQQHNYHHDSDVWEHSLRAVEAAPPEKILRWTMLLHDIGKPHCATIDAGGVGHFYGHAAISAELAGEIFSRLKADGDTRQKVLFLIKHHGDDLPEPGREIRKKLARIGPDALRGLIAVHRCDLLAQADWPGRDEALSQLHELSATLEETLSQAPCLTVRDLHIRGGDVIAAGVPAGPEVGIILRNLLSEVLEGQLENTHEALLCRVQEVQVPKPQ